MEPKRNSSKYQTMMKSSMVHLYQAQIREISKKIRKTKDVFTSITSAQIDMFGII